MQIHAEVLSRSPSFGIPPFLGMLPLFGIPLGDASEVFNIVGQVGMAREEQRDARQSA